MYFVVYILQAKKNVVVPYSWIKGIDSVIENFINNGVKPTYRFQVFWTDSRDAFDREDLAEDLGEDVPSTNYAPNINASTTSTFPHEGWYTCFIKKFKCE